METMLILKEKMYEVMVDNNWTDDHYESVSKECADVAIQFAIDVLNEADNSMRKLLEDEAQNLELSKEDATFRWNRTKWHLIIQAKIDVLKIRMTHVK